MAQMNFGGVVENVMTREEFPQIIWTSLQLDGISVGKGKRDIKR